MLNAQLLPLNQNLWSRRFNEKPSRGTDICHLQRFYSTVDGHTWPCSPPPALWRHWKPVVSLPYPVHHTAKDGVTGRMAYSCREWQTQRMRIRSLRPHSSFSTLCVPLSISVRPYAQEFPFFRQLFSGIPKQHSLKSWHLLPASPQTSKVFRHTYICWPVEEESETQVNHIRDQLFQPVWCQNTVYHFSAFLYYVFGKQLWNLKMTCFPNMITRQHWTVFSNSQFHGGLILFDRINFLVKKWQLALGDILVRPCFLSVVLVNICFFLCLMLA